MSSPSEDLYRPHIFTYTRASDAKHIDAYLHADDVRVVDCLNEQLEELYSISHPESIRITPTREAVDAYKVAVAGDEKHRTHAGVWVWYPWKRTLIHTVEESLYTRLRTSRNRNLITETEQQKFYGAHIGVAGLSVGNSVVASIVHTGGGGHMRIADHDTLSTSNLNRIRSGLDNVGLEKSVIAAREIYSVNPFADVTLYRDGLSADTIEQFLKRPKPLDVVVDEMDSLYLKIQLRIAARKLRIPVIMAADNGDGVVVDIERYDLDDTLPLMHGQVDEKELLAITPDVSRKEAARIISSWVKPENIADRMKDSLFELGKTLYTWPQLGNAAFVAGAIMAYVARKIIVGDSVVTGKVILSPEALFEAEYFSEKNVRAREKKTQFFVSAMKL